MEGQPVSVFAYGTLMRGERLHRHLLVPGLVEIQSATAQGRLIDLGGYPGLLPDEGQVLGECYIYGIPLNALLKKLDRIEGPKYRRVARAVRTESGGTELAWLYEWTGPAEAGRPIQSGNWRRR